MICGGRVGIVSGEANLFDEITLIEPVILVAPPKVWNKIYSDFNQTVELAVESETNINNNSINRKKIEKQVSSKFREMLGKRIRYLVTGGAPISEQVKDFISELFKIRVFNGYGATEASVSVFVKKN